MTTRSAAFFRQWLPGIPVLGKAVALQSINVPNGYVSTLVPGNAQHATILLRCLRKALAPKAL